MRISPRSPGAQSSPSVRATRKRVPPQPRPTEPDVGRRERVGSEPVDPVHRRGHEHRPRHPAALDQAEPLGGLERRHEHQLVPGHEAAHGVHEGCGVEQRARDELHGVPRHERRDRTVEVDGRRRGGPHDLRPTGAAARRRGLPRRGDGVGQRTRVAVDLAEPPVDDEGRTRQVEDRLPLGDVERRGQRLRRGAQLPGRDARADQVDPARERHRDHVVEPHPVLPRPGQPVRVVLEPATGPDVIAVVHRHGVRRPLRQHGERSADGQVGHDAWPA